MPNCIKKMMLQNFLARAQNVLSYKPEIHDNAFSWISGLYDRIFCTLLKNYLFHEMLHLWCIFKIFISFELIAVMAFEDCIFSWNFLKNLKIFKNFWNFENSRKNRVFKKKFQTSKCSKKFAFWVMIKQKKLQRDFLI